jgi:hypothetical protein
LAEEKNSMYVNEHWLMNESYQRIHDIQQAAARQELVRLALENRTARRPFRLTRPAVHLRLPQVLFRPLRPSTVVDRS